MADERDHGVGSGDIQYHISRDGDSTLLSSPFQPTFTQILVDTGDYPDPADLPKDAYGNLYYNGELTGFSVRFNQAYIYNRVAQTQLSRLPQASKIENMSEEHYWGLKDKVDYFVEVVINKDNFLIEKAVFTGLSGAWEAEDEDNGFPAPRPIDTATDFPHILFDQYDSTGFYTGYYPVLSLYGSNLTEYHQREDIVLSDRQFRQVGLSTSGDNGSAHILVHSGSHNENLPVRVRAVRGTGTVHVFEETDYVLLSGEPAGGGGATGTWSGENIGYGVGVYNEYTLDPAEFHSLRGTDNITVTLNGQTIDFGASYDNCSSDADWLAYKTLNAESEAEFRGLNAGTGIKFTKDVDHATNYCVTTISTDLQNCSPAGDWMAYKGTNGDKEEFRGLTFGDGIKYAAGSNGTQCAPTIQTDIANCDTSADWYAFKGYDGDGTAEFKGLSWGVGISASSSDTCRDVIRTQLENCDSDGAADWWSYKGSTATHEQFRGLKAGEGITISVASDCIGTISRECCTGTETYAVQKLTNINNNNTNLEFPTADTSTARLNCDGNQVVLVDPNQMSIQGGTDPTKGQIQLGNVSTQTVKVEQEDGYPSLKLGAGIKRLDAEWVDEGGSDVFKAFEKSSVSIANKNSYIKGDYSPATGSAILGGSGNAISGNYNVIVGGATNKISGLNMNFIGGGSGIDITRSEFSVSVGGQNNDITGSSWSVLGGGYDNLITGGNVNTIGGGYSNELRNVFASVIAGGHDNLISGSMDSSTAIAGGVNNEIINSTYAFIGAGGTNVIQADSDGGVIVGGFSNILKGANSFIGGGQRNVVSGTYGVALGSYAKIQEGHNGAFVFSDANILSNFSSGANTMVMGFKSGVYVQTDSGLYVNGNPVLTGTSAYETDTLQTVTDDGNTTNNSIYIDGSGDDSSYAPLNVSGNTTLAFFRGTGTAAYVQFQNSTTSYGLSSRQGLTIGNNGNDAYIMQREAAPLYFGTSGEARMTILGDSATHSKVGIGTVSPSSTAGSDSFLEVYGATDAGLVISSNNGEWDIKNTNPTANLSFYSAGSHRVTFATAGNVGIGSQTPARKLDVAGDAAVSTNLIVGTALYTDQWIAGSSSTQYIKNSSAATSVAITNTGNVGIGTDAPATKLHVEGTGTFHSVDITGSSTLTVSGKVGIGTSNPSHKLHVKTSGAGDWITRIDNTSSSSSYGLKVGAGTNSSDIGFEVANYDGDVGLRVQGDCNVGIGTTTASAKVHVNGPSAGFSEILRLQRDGGNYYSIGLDNNDLNFCYNGQSADGSTLVIDGAADSVGIGTKTPAQTLHVEGTARITGHTDLASSVDISNTTRIYTTLGVGNNSWVTPSYTLDVNGTIHGTSGNFEDGITINGNPVVTGSSAEDVDTLATVTSRGATTTTAVSLNGGASITKAGQDVLTVNRSDAGTAYMAINPSGGDAILKFQTNGSDNFAIGKDGTDTSFRIAEGGALETNPRFVIKNGGNVGIGLTDPDQALDVNGNIRIPNEGKIVFGSAGSTPNDYLELYDVGTGDTLLRLVQDGVKRFSVQGVNGHVYMQNKLQIDAGSTNTNTGEISFNTQYDTAFLRSSYTDPSASTETYLAFHANTDGAANGTVAEQMRIAGSNVGIGVTDPLSPLHTKGAIRIERTANTASSYIDMEGNFRYYAANGYAHTFFSQGSEMVRFYNGDVGIGSTTPAYKLDVAGDIQAKDSAVFAGMNNQRGYTFHDIGTGWGLKALPSSTRLAMQVQGIEAMTWESNGRVGIGSTNPSSHALEVNGTISGDKILSKSGVFTRADIGSVDIFGDAIYVGEVRTNSLSDKASNGNAQINFGGSNKTIEFETDATARMLLSSGGYLGIGTSNPSKKLQIKSDDNAFMTEVVKVLSNNEAQYTALGYSNLMASHELSLFTLSAHPISFRPNSIEKMHLTTGGYLGIGTDDPAELLHVDGNILIPQGKTLKGYYGGSIPVDIIGMSSTTDTHIYGGNNNSSDIFFDTCNGGTTGTRMTVTNAGNVGIGISTPSYELEVAGDIALDQWLVHRGNTGSYFGFHSNDNFRIQTDNTTALTVTDAQKVGIGTTNPQYKVDIGGTTPSTGNVLRFCQNNGGTAIRIGAGGGGSDVVLLRVDGNSTAGEHDGATDAGAYGFSIKYMGARSGNDNSLSFFCDNQTSASQTEFVTMSNNGNVGIGSTSPSNKVDIVGDLYVNGEIGIGTTPPTTSKLAVEGTIQTKVYAIGSLPSASPAGQKAFINNSSSSYSYSLVGATVNAYTGGANLAPVYSDGSYWRFG